ncbi:UNVERIFIED_CONTAM: hypothetical protein RMT77_016402 [Armadillidium vulgare]|uniref:Mitochondrial import inner membrane translocase subunit Tim23 n=1 Tax=Armadillidium nasatum TaxID=96803 RepID=A0A5N5SIA6_9CRUS|nr:Mitochondrial import inner membrane translocase subunit Tim23 [Armadillidium nasatum]KAB7502017.1 Mitochondrial import inner membrane translocase subunit Tim23 [Armadillidium nasatum]RXG53940.1 Mitochondrial import inner membrane translocase subunit Tim23 [Armadillidium vulgare]
MAIDNRAGSIFGLYNAGDSSLNLSNSVSVHSSPGLSQLSPYLSIDPSYLQTQPEYLTLEGASQKRGRLELAFSQIGGLCMTGGLIGGGQGLYRGLIETSAAGHIGKIRRTQVINYVTKRGSATANMLGVIAVMYSGLGCLLYYSRGSKEDSFNTVGAGTLTGLLYKSTSGLRKCAIGGGIGLALSSMYVLFSSRDKITEKYGI